MRGATAGSGDPGDRRREIDPGVGNGAARHRRGGLGADRAVRRDGVGRNAEQLHLGFVRIGDKAALDDVRGSGDRGQRRGNEPAGASFGRRQMPVARPAQDQNLFGEREGFRVKHRTLLRRSAAEG